MSAYQQFLNFFSKFDKERLDGLSSAYFEPMPPDERALAFNYLKDLVANGGSEESVNGLFLADPKKASAYVRPLLGTGKLRPQAELCAAWNLYELEPSPDLASYFCTYMSSPEKRIREKAALWAPETPPMEEVIRSLIGMIFTETEKLPQINATNKLLAIHGLTRDGSSREEFSYFYRGLRSENLNIQQQTIDELQRKYPVSKA